jgi:hypothetical protein
MKPRFDLKVMLVGTLNVCVFAWAIAAGGYRGNLLALPAVVLVTSLTFAWFATTRTWSPVVFGAVGGFIGLAASVLCFFLVHGVGYFFTTQPADQYFEDGALIELTISPAIFTLFYGGPAAVIGALCGVVVRYIRR